MQVTWHEQRPAPKGAAVKKLAALHDLAVTHGWKVQFVTAAGPPVSMTMRVARGARRAFGLWILDGGVKYSGGTHVPVYPGGRQSLTQLKTFEEFISEAPIEDVPYAPPRCVLCDKYASPGSQTCGSKACAGDPDD